MSEQALKLVIEGVSEDGARFRPSDWMERISDMGAGFGMDQRLRYSSAVRPNIIDGEKCLVVDVSLRNDNPSLYEYIMKFARDNRLRTRELRTSKSE